jgi:hypothetical protein
MNIYIGIVEDNIDPKRFGRIKVRVFGVYDQISTENIPWSTPFNSIDGRSFSVPPIGKMVSIVFIKNDIYTPYYIDSENYNINLKERLDGMDDDDYVNFSALLYDHRTQIYSDEDELKIDYYYNNISIDKESINFDLKNNSQKINIGDKKNSNQQALFGNHWLDWFDKFVNELIHPLSLVSGGSGSPVLRPKLDVLLQEYKIIRDTFISSNIYLVDNNQVIEDSKYNKRKYETKPYTHDVNLNVDDVNIINTELSDKISCESAKNKNKITDINFIDIDPTNSKDVNCSDMKNEIKNHISTTPKSNNYSDFNINYYNNTPYVNKDSIEPNDESEIVECDDFKNGINYTMKISKYFILEQLTTKSLVSSYRLKKQKGLKKEDIACNLKCLSENILDKIYEKFPNMVITSGFRHGNGSSQHYKGQAVDLQFTNMPNKEYYNVSRWIKENITEYDQLLLEYKNHGTKKPWIHISYNKNKNRNIALTLFNDKTKNHGLFDLSGEYGIPV